MKNQINGTEYIPATKVLAWLEEAREIINENPALGEERMRIEHSFTRYGFKVSYIPVNELLEKIDKYPHTSFQRRPELIELIHRITKSFDRYFEYQKSKTVKVIRLKDGECIMETPEIAKMVVEAGVAKYA